jgi:hypothetical protein
VKVTAGKSEHVKGTDFPARDFYSLCADEEEPMTPAEVAEAYGVPVEAVHEAIAYCRSDPLEMRQDFEDQEAWMAARGLNESGTLRKGD